MNRKEARGNDFVYSISGGDRFRSAANINTERDMRAARIDENQPGIVEGLERAGCVVEVMSHAGDGFTDLLVARQFRGELRPRLFLIEVKNGALPPSGRLLTPAQKRFHAKFHGNTYIANCLEDALAIVGLGPRDAA